MLRSIDTCRSWLSGLRFFGKMCWLANDTVLVLSSCGVKGMLILFLKVQNTQCGVIMACQASWIPWSQRWGWDWKTCPGKGNHWGWLLHLAEGNQGNGHWQDKCGTVSPPTWNQIKQLMDMAMMVTSILGMACNPAVTLLVALIIITI
jgi:hypothetical protein